MKTLIVYHKKEPKVFCKQCHYYTIVQDTDSSLATLQDSCYTAALLLHCSTLATLQLSCYTAALLLHCREPWLLGLSNERQLLSTKVNDPAGMCFFQRFERVCICAGLLCCSFNVGLINVCITCQCILVR